MIAALLMRLAPYKLLFEIFLIGSLAAGAVYGAHQFLEHERDIGRQEVRAQWDAQQRKDEQAARAREVQFAAQLKEANQRATERETTIRTLAAAAGTSSVGLRDTIAAISNGVSSATADALRATVLAYGDVLGECEGRRRGVAEEAERINSEKRTLMESWPRERDINSSNTPKG